jgi:hypothetical protein
MKSIDTMLREVVVTLKEEQACLELWFNDKSVNEDVRRGIGISLTKISEALGKLAALEKGDDHGKADSLATVSDDSRDNDGDLIIVDAASVKRMSQRKEKMC